MKAIVKQKYEEYVEHIEFPMIIYIYETGRIIAANELAREIIGKKAKNMNIIWEEQRKKKLKKETLEYGSELFYNEGIYQGNNKFEIDIEVNSFLIDNMHILVCFLEQSYKQQFVKYSKIQVPRLYIKDKKLKLLSTNRYFREDKGTIQPFSGDYFNSYIEPEVSSVLEESEMIVMKEKRCTHTMIQSIKIHTTEECFARMNRIPLMNRNGTCVGIMGIYTLLLDKIESRKLYDSILHENNILNEAVCRSEAMIVSLYDDDEKYPVEYISSNFRKYGYHLEDFYSGRTCWRDIVHKEDFKRILKERQLAKKNHVEFLTQEYRLIKPNGDIIWVQDEIMNLMSTGKNRFWDCRLINITDEKYIETKKQEFLVQPNQNGMICDSMDKEQQSKILPETYYTQMLESEIGKTYNKKLVKYLRQAIVSGCIEFLMYYQPIVDNINRELVGAEALVRWESKELGFINPVDFIPLTEYMGLIVPLGEYVIRSVFEMSRKWNLDKKEKILFHINLSVVQLVQPDIIERILYLSKEQHIDCSTIVFEVTESLAIENKQLMKKVLGALKKYGFQIALDDFGIGISSLNYIMELPFDYLKMDNSFIERYGTKEFNPNLLSVVTEFVHSMNMKIIIEGVETKQQEDFLMFMDTDQSQGFFYGKPMMVDEFYQAYQL